MATSTMPMPAFPSASPLATRCQPLRLQSLAGDLAAKFNACKGRDEWERLERSYQRLVIPWHMRGTLDQAREVAERRVTR